MSAILVEERSEYIAASLKNGVKPDVIIVDGSHRFACAETAVKALASGGIIIRPLA